MRQDHTAALWRFVRGDMPPDAFENWACETRELERDLGPDLFLRVISGGYRKPDEVGALRKAVETFLRNAGPARCACLEMRDLHVVMMGKHNRLFATLVEAKRRGKPMWWLWIARCSACRQTWLVGSEERQNDVFCLRRMSEGEADAALRNNSWPADFDRYETLIRLGIAAGIVFRFVDPMDTRDAMADLARERPGIRVSELAHLLALDDSVAATVARRVVKSKGVSIRFDSPTSSPGS